MDPRGPVHEIPPVPPLRVLKGTVGPILGALCEAVTPALEGGGGLGYRERLRIGRGPVDASAGRAGEGGGEDALERLLGVHAAAYIARECFACPVLDEYDFDPGPRGLCSFALDDAITSLENLDGVGAMSWDEGSRFAVFLEMRGGDAAWMAVAGAILRVNHQLRRDIGEFGLDDLVENVHARFGAFARSRIYEVHACMGSLLRRSEEFRACACG